jgi:CBS-domain-containing membrane protein
MLTTTKSFLDLTAFNLMSRHVVTIPRQMSLQAAAHMLAQADITGAPVVDEHGRCVGMLSSTDVVRWVDRGEQRHREAVKPIAGCMCCDWEVMDLGTLPPDAVSQFMTPEVVTTTADTRIGTLAFWMINAHIHRIVITDSQGKPVGVVSSTDILAAVAREEALTAGPTSDAP